MTPEQTRRLATQRMTEAVELRTDAARLRTQADALDGLLEPLVPMSQRVWRGPAADEFEHCVRIHSGRVNEQAKVLQSAAVDFDRSAGHKEREAIRLRAQASAMETIAAPSGVI